MSSLLNNSARKYSLAYKGPNGQNLLLKVMPGMNTLKDIRKFNFPACEHIQTEADFEEALRGVSKSDYVKVLQDNGTFVINVAPTVAPKVETPAEESKETAEEEASKKRGRPKKKLY